MLGLLCLPDGKYFFISCTSITSSSETLFLSCCSLLLLSTCRLCSWNFWLHISSCPLPRASEARAWALSSSRGSDPLESRHSRPDLSRSSQESIFCSAALGLSPASFSPCSQRQEFISHFGPRHCLSEDDWSSGAGGYGYLVTWPVSSAGSPCSLR